MMLLCLLSLHAGRGANPNINPNGPTFPIPVLGFVPCPPTFYVLVRTEWGYLTSVGVRFPHPNLRYLVSFNFQLSPENMFHCLKNHH
uniref:Uncharacterized protein n=1 Tax=Candidatus Kentrum sp. UNK TaxID=2126344 RepID=A0A451ANL1_9GAMM|nr:MAG: hypothetical protein BECKUNK1418G_GA0071005_11525 [Candidatus Kentron sp. UNK]VFK72853.1 MAG: hypothetical protein BECKUNK1418H_GA0071006_11445 [Candidatus Kentron sp. UNK]